MPSLQVVVVFSKTRADYENQDDAYSQDTLCVYKYSSWVHFSVTVRTKYIKINSDFDVSDGQNDILMGVK